MMKRTTIFCMAFCLISLLCACGANPPSPDLSESRPVTDHPDSAFTSSSQDDLLSSELEVQQKETEAKEFMERYFPNEGRDPLLNLRTPVKGEEVAVLETNYGNLTIMFLEDVAPKAVDNFKKLVEAGRFHDTVFHRVVEDSLIQGGDPTGIGTSSVSATGAPFSVERSAKALHLYGAVAMAHTPDSGNGSQFYIVQADEHTISDATWELLRQRHGRMFPDAICEQYETHGGAPWLDFDYTVFGQLYGKESYRTLEKIAGVKTDLANRPLEDVTILSASLQKVVLEDETTE